MGFLRRLRESPEDKTRREHDEHQRRAEAERVATERREATERAAAAERDRAEKDRRAAEQAAYHEIIGADLAGMSVDTPAEAKIAIKLARIRKKELQAEKRELASELADVREDWRDRQAGRISTVALGRGTTGRIIRAGVQGNRRAERQQHAGVVNRFSDQKQEIDAKILVVDRLIVELERMALSTRPAVDETSDE